MQILKDAPQGSSAWHKARAQHFCASEAAAAMGVSKYMTRSQLLHQKATGFTEEIGESKQRIFDAGHNAEAKARPIAERMTGKKLYPIVATADIDDLPLLASFDGMDMMESVIWENKLFNELLAAQVIDGDLEPHYWAQLEHQFIVSGIDKALFTTSNGTEEGTIPLWYTSVPERRAQVLEAWKQFQIDLAAYVPPEVTVKATGRTPDNLPALRIELTGEVTVSNLPAYREHALAVFAGINKDLKTDQDFADAEKTVKWCADIEDRLAAAKQHALSQTQSIDQLFSTIDEISAEARRVRLDLDKLVKAQKESIRNDILLTNTAKLKGHIADLNASIGKPLMPNITADFAGAMKGKRTVDTLRDAADTELARAKIEATNTANGIKANLETLSQHSNYSALFPDLQALVLKPSGDLGSTITARIATHEANEAQRKAREAQAQAEREAELIAQKAREDAAKAVAEAEAKAKADFEAVANTQREAAVGAPEVDATIDHMEQPLTLVQQPAAVDEMHAIGEGIMYGNEPEETGEMVRLGEINRRIAPLSITADGLAQLGFTHAATDKAAKLYLESQLPKICDALITVLGRAAYARVATA